MTATYIYDAVRTPFGRAGGALAGIRPDDLAATVMRATIERAGLDAGDVAAAKQWTDAIIGDPQTPAAARGRAEVLSQLIAASGKG